MVSLCVLLGAVALLGFGCKSPQEKLQERIREAQEAATRAFGGGSEEESEPKRDPNRVIDNKPDPSPEILYLRDVMRNLGRAETFRAKVDVPIQGGEADISIDFNNTIGMYGRLRIELDDELTVSDIFMSDDQIHFRANTSTWTNISDTDDGRVLQALFQRVTSPNRAAEKFVSEYAKVEQQTEHDSGCSLYAFKQYNELRARVETYQICVQDNLPRFVITESPFGEQRIDYSDINQFVDVVHP